MPDKERFTKWLRGVRIVMRKKGTIMSWILRNKKLRWLLLYSFGFWFFRQTATTLRLQARNTQPSSCRKYCPQNRKGERLCYHTILHFKKNSSMRKYINTCIYPQPGRRKESLISLFRSVVVAKQNIIWSNFYFVLLSSYSRMLGVDQRRTIDLERPLWVV